METTICLYCNKEIIKYEDTGYNCIIERKYCSKKCYKKHYQILSFNRAIENRKIKEEKNKKGLEEGTHIKCECGNVLLKSTLNNEKKYNIHINSSCHKDGINKIKFECKDCNHTFTQRQYYDKHMKSMHNKIKISVN